MKKTVILLLLALPLSLLAQINTPAASPYSEIEQVVGLTNIAVKYSRPGMKGRTIFGDLVPYGKIWRTGANGTTKFITDKSITIDDKDLAAGTYSVYSIPEQDTWEVIFYTDDSNPLLTEFDESKIALRTHVDVQNMPMQIETFTVSIDDVKSEGATLGILWSNAYVGVPFKVGTDKEVMESIDKALQGPGADEYYNAAVYYLNSGKDIEKSRDWMEKAMSMTENPGYWQLRQQSLILAKAGDKKGAVKAAKASLEGAEKAGNADYVKMNKDSLEAWGEK
ncbi:DUF2911 domain-containing protein [Leeuwenhoekiella sp. A2]|uniref:DUF2911 domain-containing protein n=1 Tax=Leeuwenhoekiella sp. A2 TaxID=3141460 RepID=UPI003A801FCD